MSKSNIMQVALNDTQKAHNAWDDTQNELKSDPWDHIAKIIKPKSM